MGYVEENDGRITASKLKCYLKNPAEYKIRYIDKVKMGDEEKRHFVIGTAFDDLVSYGEPYFLKKYYIDKGLVKEELLAKAIAKGQISADMLKTWKLPQLRNYMYDNMQETKVRLTPMEGEDIMGMYREVKRQKLMDFGSEYEKQVVFTCEYKGLMLKGKLDRISREKKLIRDRKTTGRMDTFEYDMEETFDYVMSMAFYYTLVKVSEGLDCSVTLDVISKKAPYQSVCYYLDKQTLLKKMNDKIVPGLDALKRAYDNDEREAVDPITGRPIPRGETLKSPYYSVMDCAIQQSFYNPMG